MKTHLERYIREVPCSTCHGARLKPRDSRRHGGRQERSARSADLSCRESPRVLRDSSSFTERQQVIAGPIVKEIVARLRFLVNVGLDYLTLDSRRRHAFWRRGAAHSPGNADRCRPHGRALHPGRAVHRPAPARQRPAHRDARAACATCGNTVIVVEHDEDTIRAADYVIDMGPGAGETRRCTWCAAGTPEEIMANPDSLTGAYLTGKRQIRLPEERRKPGRGAIKITGASANNLQNVTAEDRAGHAHRGHGRLGLGQVLASSPTPWRRRSPMPSSIPSAPRGPVPASSRALSRSTRSSTSTRAPSAARRARTPPPTSGSGTTCAPSSRPRPRAKRPRLQPRSLLVSTCHGGRCEACKGDGQIKIEMNFLPDVYVPCEVCHGKRYNRETLEVTYHGKSISDVLDMTVHEALAFFANIPRIKNKLQTLLRCGAGLHPPRPARHHALRRRGAAREACQGAAPTARRARPSTSSTSPPPACTLRTFGSSSTCSSAWWTRATPSLLSSTTSTSSRWPIASLTWVPRAATAAVRIVAYGHARGGC